VKSGARYIAMTSGPIDKERASETILVGVILREKYIEGLLSTFIKTDGTDSTEQIIKMIKKSRFNDQIKILLFNGIALAGLNVVDPDLLEKELKMKVVILNKRKQNPKELVHALNEFSRLTKNNAKKRIKIVEDYGSVKALKFNNIFIQSRLESYFIKNFAEKAFEALRISHIISSGISKGESTGRL